MQLHVPEPRAPSSGQSEGPVVTIRVPELRGSLEGAWKAAQGPLPAPL